MAPLKRQYPHVDQVKDPQIQQALRLLFDLVYQTRDDAATDRTTLTAQAATLVEMTATLDQTTKDARSALVLAGKEATPVGLAVGQVDTGGQGTGGTGPGEDDTWDNGQGWAGFTQAGSNGHVLPSEPKNLVTVGKIVGGVGAEFPALQAVAVDEPTRRANIAELIGRVIWHLQLAGFQAGKNKNPSGATGIDNFTVMVDGVWRGYDIILANSFTQFTAPFSMVMLALLPNETTYLPDGGVPD